MPKKESKLQILLVAITSTLVALVVIGISLFLYLWRFAEPDATLEEILSPSNILLTITVLLVASSIAASSWKK